MAYDSVGSVLLKSSLVAFKTHFYFSLKKETVSVL